MPRDSIHGFFRLTFRRTVDRPFDWHAVDFSIVDHKKSTAPSLILMIDFPPEGGESVTFLEIDAIGC